MNTTLEQIKETVKSHTIVPFSVRDISTQNQNLTIKDKYHVSNTTKLMEVLGIRTNLTKDIFSKPEENWSTIQQALSTIDSKKRFGIIVDDSNNTKVLVNTVPKDSTQLNFDERLDNLFDSISESKSHIIQDARWNSETCNVEVNAISQEEIDCEMGDLWKFGVSTTVGDNTQTFANYFLRLVCTNGMTTKENLAYRLATASSSIGKQFTKFISSNSIKSQIAPRVKMLRNARASLNEVNQIANNLTKEQRLQFMPQYEGLVNDFKNAGYDLDKFSVKRQRTTYTNENLYDIFNLATNLASHQRDTIGTQSAMALNKAASDIFTKGPNLQFQTLDIYGTN